MPIEGQSIAVVIPAYQAEGFVRDVIRRIPSYVDWIIVTDDASSDGTAAAVESISDPRIRLLRHPENRGVGGAMVTGFREALALKADLIAKIDADGQMDPQFLDRFARAAVRFACDYVKANRFGHMEELPAMPGIRLAGNVLLTFLTKFASGCWNVFDPQNGYVLITRKMLKRLDLKRLDRGYFFENSMLIHLNIMRAKIAEIYLPARYGKEASSMRLSQIAATFPAKLLQGYLYRIYHKYVFRSLSPFAILLIFGFLAMLWGIVWGGIAWWQSYATGIAAPTGTVMLALLPLLLGWSALLQALVLDVQDAGPCLLFDYDDEELQGDS
ncbi:MAG: glycosyltransferase family 2 protein [Syntrophales bacterium]|jgi:glycosyltransferase involved in cell wall biosynthesis|nr:glycosyltransferase family 2 protein [Syntrophales bacterium]